MSKHKTDSERAQKLLDAYGGQGDDFFKIWPKDKTFFFSSDDKAFLAYGVRVKVAVCLGDPVGNAASIESLLKEFCAYCKQQGLLVSLIQASNKYKADYRAAGLDGLLIGSDGIVDLKTFNGTTIHTKYFRNLVNRSARLGFKLETYAPPHSKELIDELKEVSDSWKSLPHRKEWSFLTGRFDEDYFSNVSLYVSRDKFGKIQAFTNDLPDYKPREMTIDLMRHAADAPPNSIDFLFIALMVAKYKQGYDYFNLGMSPLDAKPFINSRIERVVHHGYKLSDSFIGFRGLHRFKAKYQPSWEPRYVIYQKGPGHLPKIGLAVFKLLTA